MSTRLQKQTGRSWILIMTVLMLLLAGCGNSAKTTDDSAGNAAEPDVSGTKTIQTVNGDVEVPVQPKRIIADEYLGSLVALGLTPIGAPGLSLKNPYLGEAVKNAEDIGDYSNTSLEKMAEMQPDLIVTSTTDPVKYEQLTKIAPTVAYPYGSLKDAHEELTTLGALFGKEKEAEVWLADYDKRIQAARDKAQAAVGKDATFSIFEDGGKAAYVYGDNFGRGGQPVYQALGFKPPAKVAEKIMKDQWAELSAEMLPDYAGDYIILTSNTRTLADFKGEPVWKTLEAVKNDQVYIWKEERSWYYDPLAVMLQTEELADWLASR